VTSSRSAVTGLVTVTGREDELVELLIKSSFLVVFVTTALTLTLLFLVLTTCFTLTAFMFIFAVVVFLLTLLVLLASRRTLHSRCGNWNQE
jgi:TctA family transporter